MTVYVESNFVLEHALEQEECESCIETIALASADRLNLVVPAFSLVEPHHAIYGRARSRSRLGNDLRVQLAELGRSRPHREIPAVFGALAAALITNAEFEREGVRRAISELLKVAEIIPLDAAVLGTAAGMEITYGLSSPDAIVLASVLTHLEGNAPEESCFLNRNTKDFDDSEIRDQLDGLNCRFFSNFGPALAYIRTRI